MEEEVREKTRSVSILQVRTKYLEEENTRLQDRIASITQQKHGLDKLLKEHKIGKEREVSMNVSSHCKPTPYIHVHEPFRVNEINIQKICVSDISVNYFSFHL